MTSTPTGPLNSLRSTPGPSGGPPVAAGAARLRLATQPGLQGLSSRMGGKRLRPTHWLWLSALGDHERRVADLARLRDARGPVRLRCHALLALRQRPDQQGSMALELLSQTGLVLYPLTTLGPKFFAV